METELKLIGKGDEFFIYDQFGNKHVFNKMNPVDSKIEQLENGKYRLWMAWDTKTAATLPHAPVPAKIEQMEDLF